ncbi:TPA: flagellar hook-basal body complex protein FliE [Photobacterium damselae]|uniref:Flagellar hook-basal body complex protein FliE n=2 Tax=Photobacterium damselae TaxID=38293 RepID=A0A4S2JM54_PHODD|nr:flagellar hook-basal body complex protein FliE [Photobacterium damselae]AWK82447.1 flagellar hook-basal body complex protein FliE [Photobacterium damselae]KAB1181298.1 flagellar hook-basal body complex protein FliE [Photobacterium damselae subsp. damselae]KAB1181923.1 flagellar hook-basal body complex protein FliE [Photobacterium damselae subsp. damselae]MBF7099979.1 flagellar hook-basal body complex protein FliE [Photobacterium damselae]MCG3811609.1 flagellar hook-basal body complex protei
MNINGLQAEMQAMGLEAQNTVKPATGQQVSADFGNLLNDALKTVNNLQGQSSDLATRFDQGDRSVSLSDVMIARNKSSVAFEATVQVRNKMVEAYKELMNMPV